MQKPPAVVQVVMVNRGALLSGESLHKYFLCCAIAIADDGRSALRWSVKPLSAQGIVASGLCLHHISTDALHGAVDVSHDGGKVFPHGCGGVSIHLICGHMQGGIIVREAVRGGAGRWRGVKAVYVS